jgi:metal-responsive CopG/Arc/MetJ family transcriptional regulator
MKRFLLSLPKEQHEVLRNIAYQKRTSVSEEIRKAIAEYLRKESDKG